VRKNANDFILKNHTLCITPRLDVAVNFAQFVARANQSKLSLKLNKILLAM
jgi:hypothetical protein